MRHLVTWLGICVFLYLVLFLLLVMCWVSYGEKFIKLFFHWVSMPQCIQNLRISGDTASVSVFARGISHPIRHRGTGGSLRSGLVLFFCAFAGCLLSLLVCGFAGIKGVTCRAGEIGHPARCGDLEADIYE